MSSKNKMFKLTYSGKFIELSADNELDYFNLFDIIAVYIADQKRMYVWVAKRASQSLKNHIPQIRQIFSKEYPELVILRNITIEAGSESKEFFEVMDFTKENLDQHLRNIETDLLPIISEINRLKSDVDHFFISENYEKAIFQAKKIIQIANRIKDESLERDQRDFIREAHIKFDAQKKLKEIEEDCKVVINEFEKYIEAEDYRGAHKIVGDFKLKYGKDYNLISIPLAKQIVLMDENLGESIDRETSRIKAELNELNKQIERRILNEDLGVIPALLNQAKNSRKEIEDMEVDYIWQLVEDHYRKKKKALKEDIIEMTKDANAKLEEKLISEAENIYKIILSRLENAFK